MPMAGRGQRFRDAGILTPKPLIMVNGEPMFMHALASLNQMRGAWTLSCVVLAEHEVSHSIGDRVRSVVPAATVVAISETTQGSADTCLAAAGVLEPEAPLLIVDCDIMFDSPEFFERVSSVIATASADLVLLSFRSSDPRFSYAEVDDSGAVVRTVEKRAISEHALAGAYFFRRASDFFAATFELKRVPVSDAMPEYFVSLVIDLLLRQGRHGVIAEGEFTSLGTPEELAAYLDATADISTGGRTG
jgi:NDP-sugar pyrophosphorylase family protein